MDAFELVGKLTLDSGSLATSLSAADMSGPANAWGVAVGNLAAKAFASTFSAATKFARSIFETGMEFDAMMSNVSAFKEMSQEELTAVREQAIELGRTTKYTATEVGEALYYMGVAGWSSEKMMAGIPAVLQLAAASGENLGRSSDIVTDAMTALGISVDSDGKSVQHFVDVLASAASNSNTTVGMMGEAFKYLATVGGTLNYSIEDVALTLGLLANNGIKASQAGTSMRQILLSLANPADDAKTAMQELGISLEDDTGKIKPLKQLLSEMRQVFKESDYDPSAGRTVEEIAAAEEKYAQAIEGANQRLESGQIKQKEYNEIVSEAQQELADYTGFNTKFLSQLGDIAGLRGIAALLAIMKSTDEDFNGLVESIENSEGAAEKMQQKQLDNLKGDITLLNSALDGLKIMVSDEYKNDLRSFVTTFTEEIGRMGDAFEEGGLAGMFTNLSDWIINGITDALTNPAIIVEGANDFGAALGTFVGNTIENLVNNAPAMVSGLFTAGLNLAQGLIGGLFTGLFGGDSSIDAILQNVEDDKNELIADANATATKAQGIVGYMDDLIKKYGDAATTTEEWKSALSDISGLIPGIEDVANQSNSSLSQMTENMRQYIELTKQQAIEQAKLKATADLRERQTQAVVELATAEYNRDLAKYQQQEAVRAMAQSYMSAREQYYSTPNEYANQMRMLDMFNQFDSVDAIVAAFNEGQVNIKDLANAAETFASEVGDTEIGAVVAELQKTFEQAKTDFEESNANIESLSNQVTALQTQLDVAEAAVARMGESASASADSGTSSVNALHDAAKAAAGSYDLIFNIKQNGTIPSANGNSGGVSKGTSVAMPRAIGDWDVPYDNFLASLHRGEMVLTATQARQYRSNEGGANMSSAEIASAVRSAVLDLTMELNGNVVGRVFGDSTTRRVNSNISQINRKHRYGYGG